MNAPNCMLSYHLLRKMHLINYVILHFVAPETKKTVLQLALN